MHLVCLVNPSFHFVPFVLLCLNEKVTWRLRTSSLKLSCFLCLFLKDSSLVFLQPNLLFTIFILILWWIIPSFLSSFPLTSLHYLVMALFFAASCCYWLMFVSAQTKLPLIEKKDVVPLFSADRHIFSWIQCRICSSTQNPILLTHQRRNNSGMGCQNKRKKGFNTNHVEEWKWKSTPVDQIQRITVSMHFLSLCRFNDVFDD